MKSKPSKRNLCPNCISSDLPLWIFITSLIFIILNFLLLAIYIHLVPLPAWELNHKWNRLTMGLGHQTLCIDKKHGFDDHCISLPQKLQFTIKAQVEVERSLFHQQDYLPFYSCFNRLNVATDIDTLSVVENTYFSLSLNISIDICEANKTVCKVETDVCVGVSSTDYFIIKHIEKLKTVPRPPVCVTSPPTTLTHTLLPMVIHPNASMCGYARVQPLLQPSNNWQTSRIFKDAFPLINLSLTDQDKMLAAQHILIMALLLFLTVLACGIVYSIRAYRVSRTKQ